MLFVQYFREIPPIKRKKGETQKFAKQYNNIIKKKKKLHQVPEGV